MEFIIAVFGGQELKEALQFAEEHGAAIITIPTEYIGVLFARIQDPWRNIWRVYQEIADYDWEAAFGEGDESWQLTEEAIYVHSSLMEAMKHLAED